MSDYNDKKRTALWVEDLQLVVDAMTALQRALVKHWIFDASFTVARDDGEPLAEVWFDGESDSWLCNWVRGSGA